MVVSVRASLAAGFAAVGVGTLVLVPAITPLPELTGAKDIRIAPAQTPPPEFQALIEAAQRRIAPPPLPTTPDDQGLVSAPLPQVLAAPLPPAGPSDPAVQNVASDFIVNAWNNAVPWINYGVEFADYALQFVPFGYLLADQINIFYYSFFPIADSFVLDLVAPVVNAPLDLAAWINGFTDVATVTVNSLINFAINEFNYFFGWLIPPIPPIGPLSVEETAAAQTTEARLAAFADLVTDRIEALATAPQDLLNDIADRVRASLTPVEAADTELDTVVDEEVTEALVAVEPVNDAAATEETGDAGTAAPESDEPQQRQTRTSQRAVEESAAESATAGGATKADPSDRRDTVRPDAGDDTGSKAGSTRPGTSDRATKSSSRDSSERTGKSEKSDSE